MSGFLQPRICMNVPNFSFGKFLIKSICGLVWLIIFNTDVVSVNFLVTVEHLHQCFPHTSRRILLAPKPIVRGKPWHPTCFARFCWWTLKDFGWWQLIELKFRKWSNQKVSRWKILFQLSPPLSPITYIFVAPNLKIVAVMDPSYEQSNECWISDTVVLKSRLD